MCNFLQGVSFCSGLLFIFSIPGVFEMGGSVKTSIILLIICLAFGLMGYLYDRRKVIDYTFNCFVEHIWHKH